MPPCMKKLPPYLVFVDPPADGTGTTPPPPPADPPAKSDEEFLAEFGFPQNTKEEDMTPEQGRAYWRNMSKKKQAEATAFSKIGKTPAEIQKLIDDAETARLAALSEADRKVELARTEGASTASNKFLAPAIEGQVVALTRGADETLDAATARVKGALEYIDEKKFLDANGDLDASKIQTFAQSIAPKDSNDVAPTRDQLFDAMQRQHQAPPGTPGSVDAIEQATYERLSKKPKQ